METVEMSPRTLSSLREVAQSLGQSLSQGDFMGTAEVSDLLGIPQETLRWWRHVGNRGPKSFKLGRKVAYWRDDVEDWVRTQYRDTVVG